MFGIGGRASTERRKRKKKKNNNNSNMKDGKKPLCWTSSIIIHIQWNFTATTIIAIAFVVIIIVAVVAVIKKNNNLPRFLVKKKEKTIISESHTDAVMHTMNVLCRLHFYAAYVGVYVYVCTSISLNFYVCVK